MKKGMAGKIRRAIFAAGTAAALCIGLAGCGTDFGELAQQSADPPPEPEQNAETIGTGRYMEKEVLEDVYICDAVQEAAGGDLVLFDCETGKYKSGDNGESWEHEMPDWMAELNKDYYIFEAAISADGMAAVGYAPASGEEPDSDTAQPGELGTLETEFIPYYMLVAPDGTQTALDLAADREGQRIGGFRFTQDGSLYGSAWDNTVYAIHPGDGSMEAAAVLEGSPVYYQICNGTLLGITDDKAVLYDMAQQAFIEDEVLQDFIKDNFGRFRNYGNGYNFYLFFGEEGVVYLASQKGMYRHALGGSSVEQVIDGSLSSLGNPAHYIRYAALAKNQEFLVNFNDGKLVKYSYNADISTVPGEALTVYSLEGNDTVRQAISVFQTQTPQIYITYEIGMEEEGITREDALKKLSTRLLGGSGPDVLILDGMPYGSYAEKGILMDLEDAVLGAGEKNRLFANLLVPLYKGDSLYMVPAEFQLPVVAGHREDVEPIGDYKGLADALEALRREKPDVQLIEICSGSGILKSLAMVCAPSWKNSDGSVNGERIREFLEQGKRIYDAQMNGTPQTAVEGYQSLSESWLSREGVPWEESRYFNCVGAGGYLINQEQLIYGVLYDLDSYAGTLCASRIKGFEDTVIKPLDGQSRNVYRPMTLAGIVSTTENCEKAALFVKTLLGEAVQDNTHYGYPVNKQSFDNILSVEEEEKSENGYYCTFGGTAEDGTTFTWDVYEPDGEQKQQLAGWIGQADTPYLPDGTLENAVCAEGIKYLEGEQDIEAAVGAVLEQTVIYLAE